MVLAFSAVAVFGVIRLIDTSTATTPVGHEGSLGGLHAQISKAGWVNLADMAEGMAPGIPMNQMQNMPKDGDGRIEIKVTVTNPTEHTRPFVADEEFALRADRGGKRWTPSADTFGDLPVSPRRTRSTAFSSSTCRPTISRTRRSGSNGPATARLPR